MPAGIATNRPGFQRADRTGCEVTVYRQGTDAFLRATHNIVPTGAWPLDGLNERSPRPCVVGVQTQKSMAAAGQFTITCKAPLGMDLRQQIMDDDWVDVLLVKNSVKYHIVRGLVDEVRLSRAVAGSGTTTTTWTISGRDFQKVYEQTPIFFNKFNGENYLGAAAYQLVDMPNVGGDVSDTVSLFLQKFLKQVGQYGRANVAVPFGMPNMGASFIDSVDFDDDDFTDDPARISISPNLMMPEGMVWDLAKEWSDPMFCELFTELYPDGDATDNSDPSTTRMRTVLRDKPFPIVSADTGRTALGLSSPWFSLPKFSVPRQSIVAENVGSGGYERLNAFYATPQMIHELLKPLMIQLTQPLWQPPDMFLHGMRRLDVTSRYVATGTDQDLLTMSAKQRALARDYNCMNPYWLNGTVSFGCGHPALRLGCRLHIPGDNSPDEDETYYIEGVSHTWGVQQGMRTTAAVTRGWRGTDAALVSALTQVAGAYAPGAPEV